MYLNERLIKEVEAHPILYNTTLREHKETELRNVTWKEIARKLSPNRYDEDTVDKLKLRWRSLRDSFVKNYLKMQKNQSTKPYKYVRQMEFLMPYVKTKVAIKDQGSTNKVDEQKFTINKVVAWSTNDDKDPLKDDSTDTENFQNYIPPAKRMKQSPGQYTIEESSTRDDTDDFFISMARTVKKLRPLTIARIKKQIANIVMDSEIEDLQYEESVQRQSMGISTTMCV